MNIGAYDPAAWAGLVFSDAPGRGFALRFIVECDGQRADWRDLLYIVHEVGPHAPDGGYAKVSFDTNLPFGKGDETPVAPKRARQPGLVLEWSRVEECSLVARVLVGYSGVLELRGYFPWDWKGMWAVEGLHVTGQTQCAGSAIGLVLCIERDEFESFVSSEGEVVVRFAVEPGDSLRMSARVDEGPDRALAVAAARVADPAVINECLERGADAYTTTRVAVDGHWEDLAASITNNLHWMVSLKPESGRLYTPAGRGWIFPAHGGGSQHWTVFCWDGLLNALALAVENANLARDSLLAVLETQYETGNIPNWRGRFVGTPDRSQPPIGSFVALKLYLRTRDRTLLEVAFPHLERWNAWWSAPKGGRPRRDGNANGLFEWGSDIDLCNDSPVPWEKESSHHQKAAWESGQDDLPNWDEAEWVQATETLNLDAVDLNSYLALDYESLSIMSAELGEQAKADEYRTLYEQLVRRVNEHMWDEDRGMYVDRFWDGSLSDRVAASNFLPLLAGIPSGERATRMLESLCNESKFWGSYVLPTISRNDRAFQDQQYWRGSIWPPINYLVYQGLRRYQFDEVAGELASRSVELFLKNWREYQLCRENYDSRTGEGGGQRYQSWGPLLALMGIEEFLDVTPWDGVRVGTQNPLLHSTVHRIKVLDCEWTVSLSPSSMRVTVNDNVLLASGGSLVLRNIEFDDRSFAAETLSSGWIRLSIPLGTPELRVELNDTVSIAPFESVHIPPGNHSLRATVVGDCA